ncbi:acyl-CoA dehydrogenase family protein [Saccharopolyspora gloriosae]|uniref:acyl-CoA dehydrogenase family protein n=1 Tax=Saccharopolyspora gloriosae TaxID=455344 RepID=UPI001FB79E19|nr:acyl-CoA dehydrogenase family protein [Saccharopolyspora gloriosae]
MTDTAISTSRPTDEDLLELFRPLFGRIAERATDREQNRRLLHDEVRALRDAGFGAIRLAPEHGGLGVDVRQLFLLLIELAAAESNLPQALRVHFSFTEEVLAEPDSAHRREWLSRIGSGALLGAATSERANERGTVSTEVRAVDGRLLLNGTKFYSTGTLYADYISTFAANEDGEHVRLVVPADAPGVVRQDDWRGFGQRLTASGTTRFDDVEVDPAEIRRGPRPDDATSRHGFLQLVQLAGLAGIAHRASSDAAEYVRRRRRTFNQGNADLVRHDPLVQQVVGRVDSAAHAARAIVLAAAAELEAAAARPHDRELAAAADVAAYRAQVTVSELVLGATSALFDVGGASIVDEDLRLDRHWRNARTLTVHNPVIYKQRMVGDHVLNGARPRIDPSVGTARSAVSEAE